MKDSRGFTVLEALVALLLLGLLLQLAWGAAAAQRAMHSALVRRSEVMAAERAVWWALSTETGAGRAGRDWSAVGAGVLTLRAFRGRSLPCGSGPDPDGWVAVRYWGERAPEPAKDSVLVLDGRGGWRAHDLADRSTGGVPCQAAAGEVAEWWRLDPPPGRPVLLGRLFERGSYHLEDRAFRYRRGAGGRQPLTAEVLDPAGTDVRPSAIGAVLQFRGIPARLLGVGARPDTGWLRTLVGG